MGSPKAALYAALFPELTFLKSMCGVYLGGFFFFLAFVWTGWFCVRFLIQQSTCSLKWRPLYLKLSLGTKD